MNTRPPYLNGARSAPCVSAHPPVAEPLTWDRLFPLLPPDLQSRLLTKSPTHFPLQGEVLTTTPTEQFLDRWLAANPERLSNLAFQMGPTVDANPWETQALAAALAAPDLYLIDAEAGPTQWRLAISLVSQLLSARERIVVLTGSGSEADEILAQLAQAHPEVLLARAVAPMEDQRRLPASSTSRTASMHGQHVIQAAQNRVSQNLQRIEAQLAQIGESLSRLETWPSLAVRQRAISERIKQLTETLEQDDSIRELNSRFTQEQQALETQLVADRAVLAEKQASLAQLEQDLATARSQRGGLGGLFRSIFAGSSTSLSDLEATHTTLTEEIAQQQLAITRCEQSINERVAQHQADHNAAEIRVQLQQEAARRQTSELTDELHQVNSDLMQTEKLLNSVGFGPGELTTPNAHESLKAKLEAVQAGLLTERELVSGWLHQLRSTPAELTTELLQLPQVIVGPFAAFQSDPLFKGTGRFAVGLVLGCEHREEADLNLLASRTNRQVLLGDMLATSRPNGSVNRAYISGNGKPHVASAAPSRGAAFRKLWNHLHHDRWIDDDGCLIAQLQKVEGGERGSLLREPLADRPEIEIRFRKQPTGELQIAELVFPPDVQAAEAKTLLYRELGECWLTPCGAAEWSEDGSEIRVSWPACQEASYSPGDWIDLDHGVREYFVPAGRVGLTAELRFATQAGWTQESALEWLESRWRVGRTSRLPRSPQPPAAESVAPRPVLAGTSRGVV